MSTSVDEERTKSNFKFGPGLYFPRAVSRIYYTTIVLTVHGVSG